MASRRVLIVGGVAGGASCAARLRRLDENAEIFIFERGPDVSFANCGIPYYLGGVIPGRQQLLVATPERFRDWFRVEVRTRCEVRKIDRAARTIEAVNTQTGTCSIEHYDALVLAPGAAPVRPAVPGIDLPGVFTVRNLEDSDRIHAWIEQHGPTRAVVVGGGYIGLEMAENLSRRRLEVALVERLGHVMAGMDPEMTTPIHAELRRQGVDLRLGGGVVGFEPAGGDRLKVLTANHGRLSADLVIVAVGVKPDVQLAVQAGLDLGPLGGIRVDAQMRTSDPAIWAVGDAVEVRDWVTGRPALIPLAGPANRQGRVAADVICGRPAEFRGAQATATVRVFDLSVATTGATEKALHAAGIPCEKVYTHSLSHAGYYPGAEPMCVKLVFSPDDGRVLGAQAVGKEGVEKRIDVLAMAIQKRATVYDLEEAELCYAPQSGSAKDPVNVAGFVAANVLRGDVRLAHWEELPGRQASGGPAPLVVDVRNQGETVSGAVPGSVNIPLGELRTRLGELPRDREIWVHCGVGQRSYYASRILTQHGFQVANLSGGIVSYRAIAERLSEKV
jgi:NADPH-dependent 2,4-dienoyl-CoA reductase/sulfur reductase-like enzyme/rhodanese-related sulfurtransferase